jgi:hypothetical protein
MRSTPMFFRRDGREIDLIDLYGGGVFLCLNGPSMNKVDKKKLKLPGVITMGINNGGHELRPNLWTCVDDPSRFMRSIWEDPSIMKIVPQSHFEKQLFDKTSKKMIDKKVHNCPNVVGFRRNEKFDAKQWLFESTINWGNHKDHGGGRSVMISALKICFLLGFRRVYLLGCDFDMSENKKYFFEEERSKGAINNNNNSYKKMSEYYSELNEEFKKVDFEVYNCTRDSGLKVFPYKTMRWALEHEEIDMSETTEGMYVSPKNKGK